MFKFLVCSIILVLTIIGIGLFLSDLGAIKIETNYLYIETSVTVFLTLFACIVLALMLVLYLVFWLLGLPEKITSFRKNYSHSHKIKKFFDLICTIEDGNSKKLKSMYDKKIFEEINHPVADVIKSKADKIIAENNNKD